MDGYTEFLIKSSMRMSLLQAEEYAVKNGCKVLDNPTGVGYLVGIDADDQQVYPVDSVKGIYDTVNWLIEDKTNN